LKNFRKSLDGNSNEFYILQNVKYNEQPAKEHKNKTDAMNRAAGDVGGGKGERSNNDNEDGRAE